MSKIPDPADPASWPRSVSSWASLGIGTKLGVDWKRENIQRCEDGQWLKKLAHVPFLREGSAPASGLSGYSRSNCGSSLTKAKANFP